MGCMMSTHPVVLLEIHPADGYLGGSCFNPVHYAGSHFLSTASFEDNATEINRLVVWLEGVLATAQDIAPTTQNIEEHVWGQAAVRTGLITQP